MSAATEEGRAVLPDNDAETVNLGLDDLRPAVRARLMMLLATPSTYLQLRPELARVLGSLEPEAACTTLLIEADGLIVGLKNGGVIEEVVVQDEAGYKLANQLTSAAAVA
jgi:hypothetical protein